jgi:hypothetical protein
MSSVTSCVGGGLFICFTCLHVPYSSTSAAQVSNIDSTGALLSVNSGLAGGKWPGLTSEVLSRDFKHAWHADQGYALLIAMLCLTT